MKAKPIFKYLAIRVGILILVLLIMLIILYFAIDPHKNCNEFQHRHNMGQGIAMLVGSGFVVSIWFVILFIEGIMYCIKKEKNIIAYLLMIILVLGIFDLAFI